MKLYHLILILTFQLYIYVKYFMYIKKLMDQILNYYFFDISHFKILFFILQNILNY